MKNITPTKHYSSTLHQLCKLIPSHLTEKLARRYGVDKKARTFRPWSHMVSLLFAQLAHAIGLNDVCDTLRHHAPKLRAIRGAVAPSRNALPHANRERDSDMMEALFWKVLGHLQELSPGFGPSGRYRGLPRRFKRAIYAIDSTTIALVANCMDWAKHRRRKAAAKMHLRLNLQSFLPGFAVIEEASHHDDTRTLALCAGLQAGEIAVFDKAYVHFANLFHLSERGIFWVTRAKDNLRCHVCRKRQRKPQGRILGDDEVTLKVPASRRQYLGRLRRIEAEVEVNGEWVVMVFLTNNMLWAPSSVCDLYRCRWGIEVFFKQIKQTFKVCDFLGHSKHAIRWQLWAALLLLVLLRYIAFISQWPHSFTRLFTLVRGVLWDRFGLFDLADFYGTARIRYRMCSQPQQAYLPGFSPWFCGTASSHFNRFPLVFHFDFLPISIANPLHPSGLHYGFGPYGMAVTSTMKFVALPASG